MLSIVEGGPRNPKVPTFQPLFSNPISGAKIELKLIFCQIFRAPPGLSDILANFPGYPGGATGFPGLRATY